MSWQASEADVRKMKGSTGNQKAVTTMILFAFAVTPYYDPALSNYLVTG